MGSEVRSGSAGIDTEAISSCKRMVKRDFVKIESIGVRNLRIRSFDFLDVRENDGFPQEAARRSKVSPFVLT